MLPLILPAGTLCALVGPPGCGKSTFAARYPASWRICLDLFRLAATDSEADQTATPVAAEIQNLLLEARLTRNLITILDSTNVMVHVRAGLLARARYWQRPTTAVLFDVPLATVENQNASRERVVPAHVVRELHELTPTREQLLAEGFGTVYLASEFAHSNASAGDPRTTAHHTRSSRTANHS
ncbi:AAA family ATPase [Streptomyces sparsogenes]|uniref:AAA family ATPase n=1 Tax=Streptomyces sparsogenes TaxID=67365 RepID=UPI0033EEB451